MNRPVEDHRHPILVQAPVAPLDEDGVGVFLLGTGAFLLGAIACGVWYGALVAIGRAWWLWVGIAGAGLGVVGTLYCLNRRRQRLAR